MEPHDALPDGSTDNAIAVVGMACRFPGDATNIEKFWEMIRDGKDAWSEIPADRFNARGWYHPDPNRPGSVGSSVLFLFLPCACYVFSCLLSSWSYLSPADIYGHSSTSAAHTSSRTTLLPLMRRYVYAHSFTMFHLPTHKPSSSLSLPPKPSQWTRNSACCSKLSTRLLIVVSSQQPSLSRSPTST